MTMAQHFLLSAKARTLSLKTVFRMGEDAAYGLFCEMRWPDTEGEAVCPRCGCVETYNIATRRKFKCVACHHQFSVTSGTIFASHRELSTSVSWGSRLAFSGYQYSAFQISSCF